MTIFCVVEVGHPAGTPATWVNVDGPKQTVCDHHKHQYDTAYDDYNITWAPILDDTPRVARLKAGDWSFGCAGRHHGIGTDICPTRLHHHCDEFCRLPSTFELTEAGIDPKEFKLRSRAKCI